MWGGELARVCVYFLLAGVRIPAGGLSCQLSVVACYVHAVPVHEDMVSDTGRPRVIQGTAHCAVRALANDTAAQTLPGTAKKIE